MGEVWKAYDPRLKRDVAIKVSAKQFTDRFEREAHAIAALNHANVCTLHDVGPNYLVMELVEGPTLADRIREGPIPLDEALGLAKQIALGLEAAHEKLIVHRDLKPANIKIRPDGSVKVMDFGLAKRAEEAEFGPDSPTMLSTSHDSGHSGLHGAGTGAREKRDRQARRYLGVWRGAVRDADGKRLFRAKMSAKRSRRSLKNSPTWMMRRRRCCLC